MGEGLSCVVVDVVYVPAVGQDYFFVNRDVLQLFQQLVVLRNGCVVFYVVAFMPLLLFQQLVRKVCVNRGMVDKEVKSSVNAYVVYKELASVDKVRGRVFDLIGNRSGGGGGAAM